MTRDRKPDATPHADAPHIHAPRPAAASSSAAPGSNSHADGGSRRTQSQRRAASRAAILAAARAAFLERGYQSVSLEDIVARAGLTRGALYHQFDDKAGVFCEIVRAESATLQLRLSGQLAGVADPLERIHRGFEVYLESLEDIRVLRMIHVDYPMLVGPAKWIVESPFYAYTEGLLTDAAAKGLLCPVPVRATTRLVLAFYREAMVAIAYADDPATIRAEMATASRALIEGLRARPS